MGVSASLEIREGLPESRRPDLEDWTEAYYGTDYDRLVRVKAQSDPTGFFRFHQSIPVR